MKAEGYLQYFSDNDPMKKIYQGRLYKEQGDKENAYKTFEDIVLSAYHTLNFAFSLMTGLALEEGDIQEARYLAEKMGAIAGIFEIGKYHECASMLDVVCAEKNVEETYHIVEQLLTSVDSLCDFQKSRLFQHMKFSETGSLFAENLKEKLLEGFRDSESFGYMRGDMAWEDLLQKNRRNGAYH